MNTAIICATIVACVFMIVYHLDKSIKRSIENDNDVNTMFNDIETIKEIVDKIITIECYSESIKYNILTIKNIVNKYVENEVPKTNESSTES